MARELAEDARRLSGLVLVRVLVVSALFGAALSTSLSGSAQEAAARSALYAFLVSAYAAAALELVWLLTRRAYGLLAWVHVAAETLLAGWLVALTGGTEGPFTFLLLLSTVHGALAAGSAGALAAATASTFELVLLASGASWLGLSPSDSSRAAAAVFANSGGCFATAALASYLTERLSRTDRALGQRERELQRLGELYRNVVQSLGSGLMTLSSSGEILFVNQTGAEILGIDSEGASGQSIERLAPELAPERLAGRGELSLERAAGRRLLGYSSSPLREGGGLPSGKVVSFQDVTDLRRLEASVRRQSHLASLGELSASLAHEIRNPLAALSGAVQMLSAEPKNEGDARLFELIRRESAHLGKLVSDFLAFARPPRPALQPTDLATLVRDRCASFDPVAQRQGRGLACEVEAASLEVDPGQLRQVVDNLLRNALEATGPGGKIAVSLRLAEERVLLSVEDDGPGVPPEVALRLFEPFFTTKEKGTGLGLALVARIVGNHGGTVDLESPPGGGARFVVSLPVRSS